MECRSPRLLGWSGLPVVQSINGPNGFRSTGSPDLRTKRVEGRSLFSPPEVAVHLVKIACERPELRGRSLSQWDSRELSKKLVEDGIVESISTETVRRILSHHKLKPWRSHMWLSPKHPRDEAFYECIAAIIDLYTRPLALHEIVFSVDEKTSLQPRPRICATKPAKPGNKPNLVEHEYRRDGALNLFAAFNTRTGDVIGQCFSRKRQKEFISFLEHVDRETPPSITLIHIVCDNVSVHHGKEVRKWLKNHPRFQFHFTPVHCSWMNQVEQWFSILQRKRFHFADFSSKEAMNQSIMQFIKEWNKHAHPFNWTTKSAAKIMADAPMKQAA
jgi:transposase